MRRKPEQDPTGPQQIGQRPAVRESLPVAVALPPRWRHLLVAMALVGVTACAVPGPARAAPESDSSTVFKPGDEIAGKFLAGRHAENIGDYRAAAELTRDVLEALPDDEKLLSRTHLLLISVGNVDEAVGLAERMLARNEADPLANLTLALNAVQKAQYDAALSHLDKLKLERANRILVPLLRAWTLAGKGDTAAALAALETLDPAGGLAVIAGLHGGMIADVTGDDKAADAAFIRAVVASGDQVPLPIVRAYAHFLARTGRTDEARALVADFQATNPTNLLIEPVRKALDAGKVPESAAPTAQAGAGEALRAVADLLHRENVENSALIFVRLALFLKPADPAMLSLLGGVLNAQNRHDDAMAVLRSIDPASPYAWYGKLDIANALQAQDKVDEAVKLLREMVDARPERAEAARALGDFLRFAERYDEAVPAYDIAIARSAGAPDWRLHYARGIALERLKQWPPAEKDFLLALDLEPDQPLILNYLGYSWVEQGIKLKEAREMIEKAVKLRPRDGYITDSLGWVLFRLGDYEGAVKWLERSVLLVPGDPTINDHLGDAYWLVGRRQEATFQWNRALSLDPDAELESAIRDKLDGKQRPKPLPPGDRRDI